MALNALLPLIHASAASAAASNASVVFILADDLGYQDLGHFNGAKTLTPSINALISSGIYLSDYYTFRVCAPSRASIQTGRYPWAIGFYDMTHDSHHCVSSERFPMLPTVLRKAGWRTHFTGKWVSEFSA